MSEDEYKEEIIYKNREYPTEDADLAVNQLFDAVIKTDPNDEQNLISLFESLENYLKTNSLSSSYKIHEIHFNYLVSQLQTENILMRFHSVLILEKILTYCENMRKNELLDLFHEVFYSINIEEYDGCYDEIICSLITIYSLYIRNPSFQHFSYFSKEFFERISSSIFQFMEISDETLHPPIHLKACEFMVHAVDNYDFLFANRYLFDFLCFLFQGFNSENCYYLSKCISILLSYEYYEKEMQRIIELAIQCLTFNDVSKNEIFKGLIYITNSRFLYSFLQNEIVSSVFIETLENDDYSNDKDSPIIPILKILSNFLTISPKRFIHTYFNIDQQNIFERINFLCLNGSFNIKISAGILLSRIMQTFPSIWHQILDQNNFSPCLFEGIISSFQFSQSSIYNERFRSHFYEGIISLIHYFQKLAIDSHFIDLLQENSFFDIISEEEEINDELIDLQNTLISFVGKDHNNMN